MILCQSPAASQQGRSFAPPHLAKIAVLINPVRARADNRRVQAPCYSIALVNFNMSRLVRQAVAQIAAGLRGSAAFEILIADNSTDPAERLAADAFADIPQVRVIPLAENRGFVDALNRLLPICRGQWVMVMHPDVEITGQGIVALADFLAAHPRAGVVSPDLCYPDGAPCRIRLVSLTAATELRRLFNILTHIALKRKFLTDERFWDRRANAQAQTVMSVCMMFRRSALEAVAPIDPLLSFYYANDYLCRRLTARGFECHYTLSARAIHFERYTPRQMYSARNEMDYKSSTVAANPRMRRDYCRFLRVCYPLPSRLILRAVALAEDLLQLAARLRQREKTETSRLWESIRVDLASRL